VVRIDKEYQFETDEGNASLVDLFQGRSQLLVYHFHVRARTRALCHDPRQEPYAVIPHVRICAGDEGQPASLPRPSGLLFYVSYRPA
jgi:hypothetical protein